MARRTASWSASLERLLGAPPWSASLEGAPSPRRMALILEKACSIGVKSGGVRRQEEQLALAGCNRLANAVRVVGVQIVQHDHLPWLQCRCQLLGDGAGKRRRIHRSLDQPGLVQTIGGKRRHQCGVLAVVARDRSSGPQLLRRPAIQTGQGDGRAAFVDKDELLRVELSRGRPPGAARLLIAHGTAASVFFCASTLSGGWPATSSPRSTASPGAPLPQHRLPLRSSSGPIRRGQPGMGLRASEPVSRSCTTARLTVVTATSKRRAATRMGRPSATARTKRSFRSVEYARISVHITQLMPAFASRKLL
jgi:hypothetical protein